MKCVIHDEEMKQYSKGNDTWWSHKTDDPKFPKGWCSGSEPRAPKTNTGIQSQTLMSLVQGQGKILDRLADLEDKINDVLRQMPQ